jgi:hypothetical protein
MMVTYPWPVASAHVDLTGPQPEAAETSDRAAIRQSARHLEEMVGWTRRDRLRLSWSRLRLRVRARRPASRSVR